MYVYYNHLNLPDSIVFREKGKIINTYLTDGTLLQRTIHNYSKKIVSKTNYEKQFLFKDDTLHYIFTAEGYLDKNLSTITLSKTTSKTQE